MVKKRRRKRRQVPHRRPQIGEEEPIVLDLHSFWVPTEEAGKRNVQIMVECWANITVPYLDDRTPWEVSVTGGRETVLGKLPDYLKRTPVFDSYRAQLESLRPEGRYVEAYNKSGGVLNLLNEPGTAEDDEYWQQLVAAQIEGRTFASDEERAAAWREIEQKWNETPNELFSNLTPAQVWAGGGEQEMELLRDFMEQLNEECGNQGYPTPGAMITASLRCLRIWQVMPQPALGGRAPGEIIVEERNQILRRKESLLRQLRESGKENGSL
jgi:hypothetical protein